MIGLEKIYENGLSKTEAHDLYPLIEIIYQMIDCGDFKKIDELMVRINLTKISESLMGALLRVTFPLKDDLDMWGDTTERVCREIESRGESPKYWLSGLI